MAYQDNTNAVQLHIKINSENLLPVPQKYNSGSLRVPADPSWPKIPQRKLADDAGDTIEPPCIVTLTGTPRRSRTVVHTPLNQVTNVKRSQVTSTESLQKKPNQSDIATSIEHLQRRETEKPILGRNINLKETRIQGVEKPHKEEKKKSAQNYKENNKPNINQGQISEQNHSTNNSEFKKLVNITENTNKNGIAERDKCIENSEHASRAPVNDANTQVNIAPSPVQENNGQLFFVLDKTMQPHPLNAITVPREYVNQCYNVQLPILTYQNIPMQVSSTGTENVIQQSVTSSEYKDQSKTSPLMKKESEQHVHLNQAQNTNQSIPPINNTEVKNVCEQANTSKVQSNVPEGSRKSCIKLGHPENSFVPEKLVDSSDSEYYIPNINKKNVHGNTFQRLKVKKIASDTSGEETTDSEFTAQKNIQKKEFTNANKFTPKANKIIADIMHDNIKSLAQNHDQINLLSKENEFNKSVSQSNEITADQDQSLHQNYKTVTCDTKAKNKSEQNLVFAKNECTRKLCRNSEPYVTFKQKKVSAKFSRKAKSYFQKNSHSALVDSDYTSVWPNCQYNKYKRNQTSIHKCNNYKAKKGGHFNPVPGHERNINARIENTSNCSEQNYLQNNEQADLSQEIPKCLSKGCLQREHCKCETSPRSNTDDMNERPKGISPKTQELLNKSYWLYYNKLRHKIKNANSIEQQYPYRLTMDTFEKGKTGKTTEVHDKELRNQLKVNPELQTLQQCTALSTMINKALDSNLQSDIMKTEQLYMNDNIKSCLNPIAGVQNANTKKIIPNLMNNEPVFNKVNCNGDRMNDKQFLELKSIIFFGGMMYILIILLPMLYDYFYYEDDYENLTYLELIMDYILSSFQEAFGDIFSAVKKLFFYPVRL
ncbi:hypothetical protein WH47_00324 [Habropoda laboriosa]|uniref:Uncharacterized protein n=1 Tax=Habropoda laboriosa TaxID=597456 RepID=A0A0L7R1Y3_9HYME|nr:hypothetical protein WH47_00324 [Habropoda laboriosa]